MNRRSTLGIAALAAFGLVMSPVGSNAQQKSLKDQLVGTWNVLIVDDVHPDGSHVPAYGPNPIGTVLFGADGRYSLQIMRAAIPKFASNNRLKGTPEENKAVVQGMISHFGTYSVNEADKTFTIRIEGSSFPNWGGTQQKRLITSLTAGDELTWTNPTPSSGAVRTELAWKWAK
jgi:hypothetical protein